MSPIPTRAPTPARTPEAGTTGIVIYSYDNADRMTSLEDWNSKTTTFGYDYDSNWDGTTYPTTHAASVSETYGNADNLTNQTVTDSYLTGGSQSTTWTPDADELFASTQANSSTAESYGYNNLNQVTSLGGSNSYTYDQLGRVTTDTPSGGSATNFGYNSDSALCWSGTGSPTGATCTSPPTGSTTYGTNAINERCWSDTAAGTASSCSSPPSDKTTQSYAYNQLGELTCSTVANTRKDTCSTSPLSAKYSTTYTYNGDGLRMSDTPAATSPTTQQFTWDVSQSVPSLLADGTDSYLYGPNGTPVEDATTSTSTDTYLVSRPYWRSLPVQGVGSHRRHQLLQPLRSVHQLHGQDIHRIRGRLHRCQRSHLPSQSLLRPLNRSVHQRRSAGQPDRTAVQLRER